MNVQEPRVLYCVASYLADYTSWNLCFFQTLLLDSLLWVGFLHALRLSGREWVMQFFLKSNFLVGKYVYFKDDSGIEHHHQLY